MVDFLITSDYRAFEMEKGAIVAYNIKFRYS